MRRSETGVLVRISAAIGLLACLGVFAAGVIRAGDEPRTASARQDDPIAQKMDQAMRAARDGRWDEAIDAYEAVVKERPAFGEAWFRLALAVHSKGDFEGSLHLHERAASFDRFKGVGLYNLACAYAMLGESDDAFAALDRAIAGGFTDADHVLNDAELHSLHTDTRFDETVARMRTPDSVLLRFWVGEWDVYSASTGARAGSNSFTLRNDGLFILEQWKDTQGGSGESFNYFDPMLGKWKQVWSDANGVVEFVGERRGAGVMFEGNRRAADVAARSRVRMHVRPTGAGHVRQTGTRWNEDAQDWEPRYDLIYVPKGEAYAPGGVPAADG